MAGRVYERKFDWGEARRLRKRGWSYARIAEKLGVSEAVVNRVCDPRAKAMMDMQALEYRQRHGNAYTGKAACEGCGGPRQDPRNNSGRGLERNTGLCRACWLSRKSKEAPPPGEGTAEPTPGAGSEET